MCSLGTSLTRTKDISVLSIEGLSVFNIINCVFYCLSQFLKAHSCSMLCMVRRFRQVLLFFNKFLCKDWVWLDKPFLLLEE
uniref:Uncharacterized protein n=1 Tax=Pyxicephalus adspersus TaxID=30357 RepID=A0AAV3AVL8_PYXAD|nr:TPA: hypothetical protein GDO54_008650 [Pyxicephalus adspersus]